jgi:carboxylesterase
VTSALQNPHLEGGSFTWPAGPTGVLLLHGFTATTSEVRPLAQLLHQRKYTVSGPLLPGFGTTPAHANRVSWQEWLEAASLAYQDLSRRCSHVFVGGESMGGLLALYLASSYPAIAGVMAYAPALKMRSPLLPLVAPLAAPFLPTYRKRPRSSPLTDERWQGYPVYPLHAAVQMFKLASRVRSLLPAVRQPLLIVQGSLDYSVHPSVPHLIASQVSSEIKEIYWMEKSTHCVILDCELEQVAGLTARFIERALPDAGKDGAPSPDPTAHPISD